MTRRAWQPDRSFSPPPKGRDVLKMFSGQDTAERFTRLDDFVRTEGMENFYKASHRGPATLEMRVGVFRRGLKNHVTYTPVEAEIYSPWLALSREGVIEAGLIRLTVPQEKILELQTVGDPAIHLVDKLAQLGPNMYPELFHEADTQPGIDEAFSIILASIHGRR